MEASKQTAFETEVTLSELLGSEIMLHCELEGQVLTSKVDSRNDFNPGDIVTLAFDMNKAHFFDWDNGEAVTNA